MASIRPFMCVRSFSLRTLPAKDKRNWQKISWKYREKTIEAEREYYQAEQKYHHEVRVSLPQVGTLTLAHDTLCMTHSHWFYSSCVLNTR